MIRDRTEEDARYEFWVCFNKFGDKSGAEGIGIVGRMLVFLEFHDFIIANIRYSIGRHGVRLARLYGRATPSTRQQPP